ncbi:hypothetical protein [Paraburkholderia eburnea]|uniref:hypothetical protein n=1 Tax=Paraburkholderia eburnea TaxID=1189126 RepID=UPI0011B09F62|nr:hypothetical protein [Paraburkholderia eburnea]
MSEISLIGLFRFIRDAEEAVEELKKIQPENVRAQIFDLGEGGNPTPAPSDVLPPQGSGTAEYAGHGECQSVFGHHDFHRLDEIHQHYQRPNSRRILAIIQSLGGTNVLLAQQLLFDYGAVAVRGATSHWHLSPRRFSPPERIE